MPIFSLPTSPRASSQQQQQGLQPSLSLSPRPRSEASLMPVPALPVRREDGGSGGSQRVTMLQLQGDEEAEDLSLPSLRRMTRRSRQTVRRQKAAPSAPADDGPGAPQPQQQRSPAEDEEDADAASESGRESGDGDELGDGSASEPNSDAEYRDSELDDSSRFADPPSPQGGEAEARPRSAGRAAAAAARPSTASSSMSVETVASVVLSVLSPPSLIRLSSPGPGFTSPALPASEPSASAASLLYPSMPETSAASAALLSCGLTLADSQRLLCLLLLYSAGFHDAVTLVRRQLEDAGGDEADAACERQTQRSRVASRLWKLFLFALQGSRGELQQQEEVEQARLSPVMAAQASEEASRLRQLEMQRLRADRVLALKQREERAGQRVLSSHHALLSLSGEVVAAEEERRLLDAEVEAERRRQRERNDAADRRQQLMDDWTRRATRARERRRLGLEDSQAMQRDAARLSALRQQLAAEVQDRRRDNEAVAAQLKRVTDRLHRNEAERAELQRRQAAAGQREEAARREEAVSAARQATEAARRADLLSLLLHELAKRVRLMRDVRDWAAATAQAEHSAATVCREVEEAEDRRQDVEEEMRQLQDGERELRLSIAAEESREQELLRCLHSRQQETEREEAQLQSLTARQCQAQAAEAVQRGRLEAVLGVLSSEQRRLREAEERVAMTLHHIERINSESEEFDRHCFGRRKEGRLLQRRMAAMDAERAERRRRALQFEDDKRQKVRERERRNAEKEADCLRAMQQVAAVQAQLQAAAARDASLLAAVEANGKQYEELALEAAARRDERRRAVTELQRAREETEELRDKREKVRGIRQAEDGLLLQLQAAHDEQLQQRRAEIAQLTDEAEAVAAAVLQARQELGEVAVRRGEMDGSHAQVMQQMQDRLTAVVREAVRHDDEVRQWLQAERAARDAMQRESEQWKARSQSSRAVQAQLRAEAARLQSLLAAERAGQREVEAQQAAVQRGNGELSAALQQLNAQLNQEVRLYYDRFRQQQPARQSAKQLSSAQPLCLLCPALPLPSLSPPLPCCLCARLLSYAECVNAELVSYQGALESASLQAGGRWGVRQAESQTLPIHFARA